MIWRRRRANLDGLDDDIREHLARETEENIARGMAPVAAEAAARRAFGNVTSTKEEVRAVWIAVWFDQLLQDARYAIRMFRRSPGFTAVVVLTLALGVGMNTAVFSVVNAVLLRPLSYREPGRLVWVTTYDDRSPMEMVMASDLVAWRDQARSFERIAGFSIGTERVATGDEVVAARIANVSHDFWDLAGAAPAIGRVPAKDEDAMLLSYGFFERAFGGDRSVVGRAVPVNGRQVIVAGVLPPTFHPELPPPMAVSQLEPGDLDGYHATALRLPTPSDRGMRLFSVIGRMQPGISIARATAELAAIRANRAQADGRLGPPHLRIVPYTDKLVGHARTPLRILLGAVLLVLTIACANIANLLLARASARQREIAIRLATGAGRGRLLRQFVVESLILALAGAAVGLVVARGALAVMRGLIPYAIPRLIDSTIDGRVLAFALVVSLATAIVVGLLPAVAVLRANPSDALKHGAASSAAGQRTRTALVVAEIALTSVLLVAAALMVKSLWRITTPPPGLSPERVLTLRFQSNARRDYISEVIRRAQAVPGVLAAGTSSNGDVRFWLRIEGVPDPPPDQRPSVSLSATSSGYAQAIGMRVVKGRWFDEHEPHPVCVINDSLARKYFSGRDPIGARLFVATGPTSGDFAPIVGIVADLHYSNLETPVNPEVFVHYEHIVPFGLNLAVRTAGDPMAIAPALRTALASVDKTRPMLAARTLETVLSDSIAPRRFNVFLLATFAGTALILALVGIYGVMAYAVARRTREIGVRMALGAERRTVIAMIVRQGMTLALAGIIAGVAAALALTRVMAGVLYEVTPTDPAMFVVAAGAFALTALCACAGPAFRAALVDPTVALRCD